MIDNSKEGGLVSCKRCGHNLELGHTRTASPGGYFLTYECMVDVSPHEKCICKFNEDLSSAPPTPKSIDEMLGQFITAIRPLVLTLASEKGYKGRVLFDSVAEEFGLGHAFGEIRYKTLRYYNKNDPSDLLKGAAWFFLLWDWHMRTKG